MIKQKTAITLAILILLSLITSACGPSDAELTPTLDPNQLRTEVASTIFAELTATALAQPTPTNTSTPTPTIAVVLPTSGTPFLLAPGAGVIPSATPGCYRMAYVSDVTIPDNTAVTAGQSFTKTWRVKNTGTCNWEVGYKLAFTGGEAMGGAPATLATAVTPNSEIEISVPMVAPNKTGSVRGNWRMSTASGQFFGDEIYVMITIGGTAANSTSTSVPANATATIVSPTATTTTP